MAESMPRQLQSSALAPTASSERNKALDYENMKECLSMEEMIDKVGDLSILPFGPSLRLSADFSTRLLLSSQFDVAQITNRPVQVSDTKLLRLQKFHVTRQWEEGGAGRAKLVRDVKEVLVSRWPGR